MDRFLRHGGEAGADSFSRECGQIDVVDQKGAGVDFEDTEDSG